MKDFTPIPRRLMEEAETSAHIAVFTAIAWHRNKNGLAIPGIVRVAMLARVSRQTAITAINWLRDHKFIEWSHRDARQARSYSFPDLDETGLNDAPVNDETGACFRPMQGATGLNETLDRSNSGTLTRYINKKKRKSITASSSDEQPAGVVFNLPLKDGSEYGVPKTLCETYVETYKAIDVMEQFAMMRAWLVSNPGRQKTRAGIKTFINGWLKRERGKPDGAPGKRSARPADSWMSGGSQQGTVEEWRQYLESQARDGKPIPEEWKRYMREIEARA